MKKTHHPGVFTDRNRLYTVNAVPGRAVYGERLVKIEGKEFREWDPRRSKLAAGITKGLQTTGIRSKDVVLYLGASTGTTVSHLSDMLTDGFIFALDFAPRVVRDLVFVCEERENIAPILADAFKPETYADRISEVDVVYMDLAQRNQVEIFLKNIEMFLKPGGYCLLALKARSVDVTKKPSVIYKQVKQELSKKLKIVDSKDLAPYEKDHCLFILRNSR